MTKLVWKTKIMMNAEKKITGIFSLNLENLKKDFHKQGEECFESCSNIHIHSVAGLTGYFNDPDIVGKIRI